MQFLISVSRRKNNSKHYAKSVYNDNNCNSTTRVIFEIEYSCPPDSPSCGCQGRRHLLSSRDAPGNMAANSMRKAVGVVTDFVFPVPKPSKDHQEHYLLKWGSKSTVFFIDYVT